jgi:hypothetical protein
MSKDYIPKSSGESFLNRVVNKHNATKRKFEDQGKKFSADIVSIPLEQADEIIKKYKVRAVAIPTIDSILEELQEQVNAGFETYSPSTLRMLVSRARLHFNKIK